MRNPFASYTPIQNGDPSALYVLRVWYSPAVVRWCRQTRVAPMGIVVEICIRGFLCDIAGSSGRRSGRISRGGRSGSCPEQEKDENNYETKKNAVKYALFLRFFRIVRFWYGLRAAATAGVAGRIRIFLYFGFRHDLRGTAARILFAEDPFKESFLLCHDEL